MILVTIRRNKGVFHISFFLSLLIQISHYPNLLKFFPSLWKTVPVPQQHTRNPWVLHSLNSSKMHLLYLISNSPPTSFYDTPLTPSSFFSSPVQDYSPKILSILLRFSASQHPQITPVFPVLQLPEWNSVTPPQFLLNKLEM